jgi:HEAT repeat protein
MNKPKRNMKQEITSGTRRINIDDISVLITDLASEDSIVRIKARMSLVALGHQAVPQLLSILSDRKQWVRWEAVKALSQIHDVASVNGLINALMDKMFDVRWIAAEGLIAIGDKSLIPLLRALIDNPDSVWMREGAHHVFHDLSRGSYKEMLKPVLDALEGVEASLNVPFIAKSTLESLENVR